MPKISILDRAIASVAPLHARRRLEARAQIEAYGALPDIRAFAPVDGAPASGGMAPPAGFPARSTWLPRVRDARGDTLPGLPLSRAASRELVRTSAVAAGALQTNADRVVGTGLALAAHPSRRILGWSPEQTADWKAHVQAEFSLWSDNPGCDQEQTLNFYEMQALVLRATLESGDAFTVLPDGPRSPLQPYALRVQCVEADRVGSPTLLAVNSRDEAGGVQFDPATGAPLRYHFYDTHPGAWALGGGAGAGQWVERVGKNSGRLRVLHHYQKKRPGMVRGVPYLAPVVDCLKQLARYSEAELMAAVISAYLTVFITTPTADASPVFAGDGPPSAPINGEVALGQGAVIGLAPGETVTTVNPNRPNPEFGTFVESLMTQIGMALGLPRELLVKQFNSSYSASKAALLDAWVYVRGMRYWLANSFCQPVYETWLAEAVAIGRIEAPGFFKDPLMRWAYTRAAWPGDSMGSINPKDEVEAYTRAIDARLMTRERAEWELWGSDFNQTFDQKADEMRRLADADMLPAAAPGAAAQPAPTKEAE